MVDVGNVTRRASSPARLYANARDLSIYSSHIHNITEHCARVAHGISSQAVRSCIHTAPIALARQTAMYLAHVTFGLTFTEVGRLFRRDRTTVAHACAVIEDLRDDPAIDRALSILEGASRRLHSTAS